MTRLAWIAALGAIMTGLYFLFFPWLNFGAESWMVACLLPLGAVLGVVVAAVVPTKVTSSGEVAAELGFSRY